MSGLRCRGLQLDDPPGPGRSGQRGQSAAGAAAVRSRATRNGQVGAEDRTAQPRPLPESGRREEAEASGRATVERERTGARDRAAPFNGEAWRAWSGIAGVGSFRLLAELADTARELELAIGVFVTAAITQLLDQPPDAITAVVDRADDAWIQGRRRVGGERPNAGR